MGPGLRALNARDKTKLNKVKQNRVIADHAITLYIFTNFEDYVKLKRSINILSYINKFNMRLMFYLK